MLIQIIYFEAYYVYSDSVLDADRCGGLLGTLKYANPAFEVYEHVCIFLALN
jgi:hypothetical protein